MLHFLAVDDTLCKREFAQFMHKNKKAVKVLVNTRNLAGRIATLLERTDNPDKGNRKLAVNSTESITLLNISEIIRCESHRNYTSIFLTNKDKIVASKTLMDFEDVLGKHKFLRIHKSHLININYLDKYVKSEGGYVILADGTKLPVAIRKREHLFRELEKL